MHEGENSMPPEEAIEVYDSLQDHLLVKVEEVDAQALFVDGGVDAILAYIQEQIDWDGIRGADLEKESGRKEIKSTAYAIARVKTALDDKGKALVADKKAEVKKIDLVRKRARDFCEDLKERIRERLTERQARIDAEQAEKLRVAEIKRQAEAEELERLRREKAEREARDAQRARDEQIRKEAEERTRREQQEALEAERRRLAESEERVKREAMEARQRAEREKQAAIEAERQRIADEQAMADLARERANEERQAREQNEANRQRVFGEILDDLQRLGMEYHVAAEVLEAIEAGGIRHVSIDFSGGFDTTGEP